MFNRKLCSQNTAPRYAHMIRSPSFCCAALSPRREERKRARSPSRTPTEHHNENDYDEDEGGSDKNEHCYYNHDDRDAKVKRILQKHKDEARALVQTIADAAKALSSLNRDMQKEAEEEEGLLLSFTHEARYDFKMEEADGAIITVMPPEQLEKLALDTLQDLQADDHDHYAEQQKKKPSSHLLAVVGSPSTTAAAIIITGTTSPSSPSLNYPEPTSPSAQPE